MRLAPQETRQNEFRCPRCDKPVTVGVMHRVEKLADRPPRHRSRKALPYWSIIPLSELIAEVRGVGVNTRSVTETYCDLLGRLGSEFHVLLHAPLADIERSGEPLLAEAIRRMRAGQVSIAPSYDGEYGTVRISDPEERRTTAPQMNLFS